MCVCILEINLKSRAVLYLKESFDKGYDGRGEGGGEEGMVSLA